MKSSLSRRDLIRLAATGTAAAILHRPARGIAQWSSSTASRLAPFVDPLPRLRVLSGDALEIAAANAMHKFHRDLPATPTFGYGGESYLGPVIEAQRDRPTRLTFHNMLGEHVLKADLEPSLRGISEADRTAPRAVLHLHGGVTPPKSDGHPEATILPGSSEQHVYPNQQEAAALWYHDHALGLGRLNRYAGLAGMYLLRDQWDTGLRDNPLGLPAGDYELPLVLMERTFNADGSLHVRGAHVPHGSREGGQAVNTGVVNGVVWPELEVDRGQYRLRIVNGGSSSVWNLHFSNQMTFWVIGGDGGLLNRSVPMNEVRLAPGERIDMLVDFGPLITDETVTLCNKEPVSASAALLGNAPVPVFCRFRARRNYGLRADAPFLIRTLTSTPPRLAEPGRPRRVRNLTIGEFADLSRLPPHVYALNNLGFETDDMERPAQGMVERWNLINVTAEAHPVHVQLANFHVLGSQALDTHAYQQANPRPVLGTRWSPAPDAFLQGSFVPRGEHLSGTKDTVIVDGNSVTSIVIRWPTADRLGFDPDQAHMPRHDRAGNGQHPIQGYVWHCHPFDHEDQDMMLPYRLLNEAAAPAQPDAGSGEQRNDPDGGTIAPSPMHDQADEPDLEELPAEVGSDGSCSVSPGSETSSFPWLGLATVGVARWARKKRESSAED